MVKRPNTWILLGRTRVTATSRSVAPISRPTPEPKASSLRKSLEVGKSSGMWEGSPGGVGQRGGGGGGWERGRVFFAPAPPGPPACQNAPVAPPPPARG